MPFWPAIAPNRQRLGNGERTDRSITQMLPLFAAVFIDLFSFGLMTQ